ncbi:phosphoribosylanthranilate isomerase [Salinirubellus salinus]|uniref:N-(5'-phosphoribosyl)anthranilate isomerase n=1 Tax=Salinirubellus salinus TaxID=1364945 RepID=A0A9E7U724_9EURY|nr:phosphoribosylanthranilate isomerase [Salinirubellus salinus]UWM53071.1 phosphoribosylanthranilate isomerase [Salinirubellus salinus]
MTRVKVCGVTREADLRAVADAGADAVGLISGVSVDTPREVSPERAASLAAAAPPFLTSVLVTMPERASDTVALAERVGVDAVQVHGVDPETAVELRSHVRTLVVATDADRAPAYEGCADGLLVDSVDESGAGGTGETHDWARTRELVDSLETPVVLAGGLTPENVGEAVETVGPYGVDVASGTEASGGVKDHDRVRAFVRNTRRGAEVAL